MATPPRKLVSFEFLGEQAPPLYTAGNLQRGFTTGSAATAALKAALLLLERGERPAHVTIALPDDVSLRVPVESAELTDLGARAATVKDGGDDPDATHGATLWAEVKRLPPGSPMTFHAGAGVGVVTAPGLRVPVGEAAINPVPRRMLRRAALDVSGHEAYAVTLGCVNGEAIARKTFNPRLGVVGGISILGTSGVVEPMSLEAYAASVEVYARVAAYARPNAVVFTPGKLGRDYAQATLGIARDDIVQISNFVGAAVDALQDALHEMGFTLPLLLVAGHPGKLAKVLNGDWDTHSRSSPMAMNAIARVAAGQGLAPDTVEALAHANTVDACVDLLTDTGEACRVWNAAAHGIARCLLARTPNTARVQVALFALDGTELGVQEARQ